MEYGSRCGSLPLSNNADVVQSLLSPLTPDAKVPVPYVVLHNHASTTKGVAAGAWDWIETPKDMDDVNAGDNSDVGNATDHIKELNLAAGSGEAPFVHWNNHCKEYSGPPTPNDKDESICKDDNKFYCDDTGNDMDTSTSNIHYTPSSSTSSSHFSNEISSDGKSSSEDEEEFDSDEDEDLDKDSESSSDTYGDEFITRREMAAEIRLLNSRIERLEKVPIRNYKFTIKHQNVTVKVKVTPAKNGACQFNSVTLQERIASAVEEIMTSETRQDIGNRDSKASKPRESAGCPLGCRNCGIARAASQANNAKPWCITGCQSGCNTCGFFRDSEGNWRNISSKGLSQLGIGPVRDKKCEGCWGGCNQCRSPLLESVDVAWGVKTVVMDKRAHEMCSIDCNGCSECQPGEEPEGKSTRDSNWGSGPQVQSVESRGKCWGWGSGTTAGGEKPARYVWGTGCWGCGVLRS